ncbi:MAG: hypothetical protein ACREV6_05980 [Clostridium sp.]|uniref:hypothetical protein n=1 Tax=Clostridium sp. TaxID=1506 RepID=UPI003D6DA731
MPYFASYEGNIQPAASVEEQTSSVQEVAASVSQLSEMSNGLVSWTDALGNINPVRF